MTDNPLVSIVVTNFNYADFVSDAIDSALNQTYSNIQVIVVDDGSTDGSADIIRSYGEQVLTLFRTNQGQGASINAGFDASSGEYLSFLDADDVLHPSIVQQVVEAFGKNPDAVKVQFRMQEVNADLVPTGGIIPRRRRRFRSGDLRAHFLRHNMYAWPWTSGSVYRRAALIEVMPIPPEVFRRAVDEYLAHSTVLLGPIVSLDTIGASYRIHDRNASTPNQMNLKRYQDQVRRTYAAHDYIRTIAKSQGLEGFPESANDFRNLNLLVPQMTSFKLDRANHPIESDSAFWLVMRVVRTVACNPEFSVIHRLANIGWAFVFLFSPRFVARQLWEVRRSIAQKG